jgi:hypothetical protein
MADHGSFAPELRIVPIGFQTVLQLVPPTPTLAVVTKALLIVTCLCVMAGIFTRISLVLATLCAFYGLGLAQIHGTVTHNHHLVWLLALLAASPCADVLSVDAWRNVRKGHSPISLGASPTFAHSLALLVAWALIAVVFFFPGLWKLRSSGLDWISSDNLRYQMYWKWYQTGVVPFFRIDRLPVLCRSLAFMAVLFELSLGVLIFFRRTRPLALLGLVGFHAFTHVFLHIRYPSLWMCYVMFIDWRAVVRFVQDESPAPASNDVPLPVKSSSATPVLVVGAFLLSGSIGFGIWGVQRGWPFACYPTFEWKPGIAIPSLRVELVYENERAEELPLPRETSVSRAQKQWGIAWSLAGVTDRVDEMRLRALVKELEKRPDLAHRFRGAQAVRVYRAVYSVAPEAWGEPPIEKVLLAAWPSDKVRSE